MGKREKCKYLQKSVDSLISLFLTQGWRQLTSDQLQTGARGKPTKSTQVESVTEGRHRKRFVALGRRDSVEE